MFWIHFWCGGFHCGDGMDDFIRKVYERGKVTIPKELRDLYDVKDGDLVKLRIIKVVQAADRLREQSTSMDVDVLVRGDDLTEVSG